jgi:hypothetical protein
MTKCLSQHRIYCVCQPAEQYLGFKKTQKKNDNFTIFLSKKGLGFSKLFIITCKTFLY